MHHGQFTIHGYMACVHHVKCPPHFSGRISGISAQVAYGAHPSAQGGSEGGCEGGGEGVREVGRG